MSRTHCRHRRFHITSHHITSHQHLTLSLHSSTPQTSDGRRAEAKSDVVLKSAPSFDSAGVDTLPVEHVHVKTAPTAPVHQLQADAPEACTQPASPGPCRARKRMWYSNALTGNCEPFLYGGCKGNDNRFVTQDACLDACYEA